MKLTTHLHLVPRSRMVELYLNSYICLYDIVLNELSTGTTYILYEQRVRTDCLNSLLLKIV
jgi:hypothetical protein